MRRSCRANTVPCAMTNRLRSLASRVITSWARASAGPPRTPAAADRSTNGITAMEARRGATDDGSSRGRRVAAAASAGAAAAALAVRVCLAPWPPATRRESARSRGLRPRTAGPSPPDAPRPRESGRAGRARPAGVSCDAPVERRKLEPLLQIAEHLVVRNACRRDAPAGRRGSRGSGAAAR